MKMLRKILIVSLIACNYIISFAQVDNLKKEIEFLIKDKKATVGVSIIANNFRDTININENVHYPMLSVFKFPIALATLSEVDKGKFSLEQKIKITQKDLLVNTWSPIREKYPKGTYMSLSEIIRYTVSESDNNGADILLRLLGGTFFVEEFLLKHQNDNISIKATEEEMHQSWDVQFKNWATVTSLTKLLTKFYGVNGEGILSEKSFNLLWKYMVDTYTGVNRLKGQLPSDVVVAHKTGTSGVNNNIALATNDIGIIILPNGEPIFISVLVFKSLEDSITNEKIISDIAEKVWKYYSKK